MDCRSPGVELTDTFLALMSPPLIRVSRQHVDHVVFILLTAPDGRCCTPHFPRFFRMKSGSEKLKGRPSSQAEGDRRCAAWRVREAGNDPATSLGVEALEDGRFMRAKLRDIARNPQQYFHPTNLLLPCRPRVALHRVCNHLRSPRLRFSYNRRDIRGRSGRTPIM